MLLLPSGFPDLVVSQAVWCWMPYAKDLGFVSRAMGSAVITGEGYRPQPVRRFQGA